MKAALLVQLTFPPPPTGTDILSGFYGPGTWLTANAGKSPVMQKIIGNIILFDIIPHLLFGPVYQGIDLKQSVVGIPLHHLIKKPGDRLVFP